MASINRSRNAEFAPVADDDPFAELTRIVGQDSHMLAGEGQHPANDPLGLDMENELMGNLARFERPERAPVPPIQEPADEIEPASGEDDFEIAMDAEFEAAFQDEWNDEEAAAPADAGAPASEPEDAFAPLPQNDELENISEPEQNADHGLHLFDRVAAELQGDGSARTGIVEDDQARTLSDEEITAFAAGWEKKAGEQVDAAAAQEAPAEPSFVRDEAPEAEPADMSEAAVEMPDLLLGSDLETAFAGKEDESGAEFQAEDDIAFDYDRVAADRHEHLGDVLDAPSTVAFDEMDATRQEEPETFAEADEPAAYIPLSEPDGAARPAPSTGAIMRDAVISTFATVPFWSKARQDQPAPQHDEHQDTAAPETLPSAEEFHAEPPTEEFHVEPTAEEFLAEAPVPAEEPAVLEPIDRPQIDTIDIEDRAAALDDDLDIPDPELPPEPVTDSEFHELAAELAGAFGDMTDEALAQPENSAAEPPRPAPAFAGQEQYRFDQPDAGYASEPPAQEQYQFETAAATAGFDAPFAPEGHEDFNAWAGGMDDEEAAVAPAPRRTPLFARVGRRGVLGAALLGGLIVIGGASVFALSAGGGGLGKPALIEASDEPFKVKPKDPGGTTVSTGNNEVYQRASGNVGDVPEQKALLTTAEEPLDLSKAVQPRIVDASAVRGALSDEAAAADDDWSKSQARLTPTDEAQGSDVPPALTVQARRVETFIVKPDGTLVPREPAQDETTEVASATSDAQAAGGGAVMDDSGGASAGETAAPAATNTAPEPEEKTTTQAESAEPTVVASKATADEAEKPALAPAATKAASGWSVQISSQPTPEAAQESYRMIAGRYGDLLAGRGVNIIKADISGKGIYYRVRIPSTSKDDAIDLCTKLKDAGGNCFVSK